MPRQGGHNEMIAANLYKDLSSETDAHSKSEANPKSETTEAEEEEETDGHDELHASLSDSGKSHLHYFWYVGKDQVKPITQTKHKRSCHVKLMIVDEHIGIMGNGNQDTQSWYHSQEINVMIDSEEVCRAWIDGLRRNQNTHLYGQLSQEDGIWRDAEGNQADGVTGPKKVKFGLLKGTVGVIGRVTGTKH
jgi:phosphatidylserine/phosphatidylglycerophosphate/cardiolipin synthase-like enzyme